MTHFLPFPSTGHGALQRTHHLLRLAAAEHDVGLIALAPGAVDTSVPHASDAHELTSRLAFCDVYPLARGPLGMRRYGSMLRALVSHGTFWEYWFANDDAMRGLHRRIAQFMPDVVHFDSALLTDYVSEISIKQIVVTHHNIESDLYLQRGSMAWPPIGWLLRREATKLHKVEKRLAGRVANNIVVSDEDGRRLRQIAPAARTSVVPNGVDVNYFQPSRGVVARAKSLVFAGGMDWYPNRLAMEWLASDLWPRLIEADSDRTMTVVGRKPPPTLRALADKDPRLNVTGFVDDVRPYVSSASAYVCPIQVGGGTRLKILDALAMQRPLVSTTVGVSGLGLTDGVHYLRADTVDDFVTAIAYLDRDAALRERLGRAGRAFVGDRFAWETIGAGLMSAFRDEAYGR